MKSFAKCCVILVLAASPSPLRADSINVEGMVIAEFKSGFMPEANQIVFGDPTPSFGTASIDEILEEHECYRIEKLLATFDQELSEAGRLLERTFVIYYSDNTDPTIVSAELAALEYFESVRPNRRLEKIYGDAKRYVPADPGFVDQWNLDDDTNDQLDIDAPEAWAIERGDPNIIIGVIDTGTMIDISAQGVTGNYRLHNDLTYYFNPFEDNAPTLVAGYSDMDDTDGADPDDDLPLAERKDNVIGHTFLAVPSQLTDPDLRRFWKAMPHDWFYTGGVWGSFSHGTHVASVAASTAGTGLVAGVANQCKVYFLRDGGTGTSVIEETRAIIMASAFAHVINMSWSYREPPEDPAFLAAILRAANDLDRVLISIAGNLSDGLSNVGFPGRYDEVLAVGNMGTDFELYDSAYGPTLGDVELVAPVGVGIPAAGYDASCSSFPCTFTEDVGSFGGTSAAAPQVAGVAALIRSRFPNLTQSEVRARLLKSAEWYWGSTTDDSLMYGSGKINAYRAITEWGSMVDEDWTPSEPRDSIYYVSGDLTIEPGSTLTIDAGTIVKIAPDHEQSGDDEDRVQIIVEGTLVINGTAANPVIFESFNDQTNPGTSDWVGIKFESGSSGTISHAIIKNAATAIENHSAISLSNCSIRDCAVAIDGNAAVTLSETVVSSNASSTAAIDLKAGNSVINMSTVVNNTGSAVALRNSSNVAIDSCVVAFNGGPALRFVSGWTVAIRPSAARFSMATAQCRVRQRMRTGRARA